MVQLRKKLLCWQLLGLVHVFCWTSCCRSWYAAKTISRRSGREENLTSFTVAHRAVDRNLMSLVSRGELDQCVVACVGPVTVLAFVSDVSRVSLLCSFAANWRRFVGDNFQLVFVIICIGCKFSFFRTMCADTTGLPTSVRSEQDSYTHQHRRCPLVVQLRIVCDAAAHGAQSSL